jgi:hypothetical protein
MQAIILFIRKPIIVGKQPFLTNWVAAFARNSSERCGARSLRCATARRRQFASEFVIFRFTGFRFTGCRSAGYRFAGFRLTGVRFAGFRFHGIRFPDA